MNNLTSINPATDDVSCQDSLVDRIITNIIHLPVPERLKAIEDIWDSIVLEPDALEVPQWHREELRRRLETHQSKPKDGSSWSDVRQRIEGEHQSKI